VAASWDAAPCSPATSAERLYQHQARPAPSWWLACSGTERMTNCPAMLFIGSRNQRETFGSHGVLPLDPGFLAGAGLTVRGLQAAVQYLEQVWGIDSGAGCKISARSASLRCSTRSWCPPPLPTPPNRWAPLHVAVGLVRAR